MHEHSGFLSLQTYRLVGLTLLCLGDFPCHLVVRSFLLVEFCYPVFATQAMICQYILPALFETLLSLKSCSFQVAAIPAVSACSFCLPLSSPCSLSSSCGTWGTVYCWVVQHIWLKNCCFSINLVEKTLMDVCNSCRDSQVMGDFGRICHFSKLCPGNTQMLNEFSVEYVRGHCQWVSMCCMNGLEPLYSRLMYHFLTSVYQKVVIDG